MCLHRVRRIAQLIGSTSGAQAQMPLYGRRHFVMAHNISVFNRQFIADIIILNVDLLIDIQGSSLTGARGSMAPNF